MLEPTRTPLLDRWGQGARNLAAMFTLAGFFLSPIWVMGMKVLERVESMSAHDVAVNLRLDSMSADIQTLSQDLMRARSVERVFEMAPSSRPREGFCVAGEPCTFVIIVRRTQAGLNCEAIFDQTRHLFYSRDLSISREVTRVDQPSGVQLTSHWYEGTITVETPNDFPSEAAYAFISSYTHCNGPEDNMVVQQEGEMIPVRILRERPAVGADATDR